MSDTRPINVRIFACPDVSGEWVAVCPELDVVTHGRSRVHAAEMFADALRMIEEHDAARGDDPFARASLSDDTVSVYAAMLRDVTAALRRPGDKAASPEACAMLREALDGLDDALENHELAHTVGPLLDEAKATLASDDIPEEESQEWAERLASYEVSDLVGWSFDGIDDWSTLGDRVRDFAPTIEAAIVYLAPHFIPQIQLRERRVQGVDRVEIVWPGESHELVIALHANREHDSWRLETSWRLKTSPPQTIVESGPLDTLNLPLALLATIDVPPLRWSPFALQVTPAWVPPDGCKVTSRLGDIVGCTLTPAALAACEADPAVLIAEESTGKCHNGTEGG